MNCTGLLSTDINNNCADLHQKGFKAVGKLLNYDDIDWGTLAYNTGKTDSVKTLALATGKTGFDVVQLGNQPFNGTKSEFAAGTYRNGFNHVVSLVVLNNDPSIAEDVIDALANGKFVCILQSMDMGVSNDGAFKIYGLHNGLHMTSGTNDAYSEAANGWVIELTEENSPNSSTFLWDTDYTTTLAKFNAY